MIKALCSHITIVGLCFLIVGSSFADGGGVKSVSNSVLNKYCEDLLAGGLKTNYNGPKIKGTFTAHEDNTGYTAHVN